MTSTPELDAVAHVTTTPEPDTDRPHLAAVVLAAGAGSRFSPVVGAKLLAPLRGRPVLAWVLDAVRAFGPRGTVVVLGHGREAIEAAIAWHGEVRVTNPLPERGLASSLQTGFHALDALPDALDGAFVVLGDQPLLRPEVMHALAGAAHDDARAGGRRTIFVPRYVDVLRTADPAVGPRAAADGPRNPALLLRAAWPIVAGLEGDRGLGPLVAALDEAVLEVPVRGSQPDVDTVADLAELERHPRDG